MSRKIPKLPFSAILFCLCFSTKGISQELLFSQYFNAEMLYNPADAGHFSGIGAQLLTRTQWMELNNPLRSNYFSASYGFHKKEDIEHHLGGVGLEFHNFNAGDNNITSTGFSINPAYNIYLDENKVFDMSFGLKLGYEQRGLNPSALKWGTQFNPSVGFDPSLASNENNLSENVGFMDIGAGVDFMYRPEKTSHQHPLSFFVKLAGMHLTRPNVSFYGVDERIEMIFNADLGIRKGFSESFTMGFDVFAMSQGENTLLQPGLFGLYKLHTVDHGIIPHELKVGVWYRVEDAAIALFEFGNHNYSIGFSYDFNNSGISETGGNYSAFEISLRLHLMKKVHKESKPDYYYHSPRT